jgi:uncharacterized protein (TIGR02246 family)
MRRRLAVLLVALGAGAACRTADTGAGDGEPEDAAEREESATEEEAGTDVGPLEDAASDEAALREIGRRWLNDVASKDSVAIAAHYAPDAVFVVPYEAPQRGTAAIRSAWGRLLTSPNLSLTWETEDLRIAESGDVAWEWGTYRLSLDAPQGPVNDRGSFLIVWEKRDGEWKAAADVVSSEVFPGPPAEDAAPAGGDAPPAGETPAG